MTESAQLVSQRRAVLALILVNVLWGSSFPVMKALNLLVDEHFGVDEYTASSALRAASAAWMIGLRFFLALILFMIFFRKTLRRIARAHFVAGIAIGTLFFAGMVLQVAGLSTIPASRSGFLTSLAVVWTPIMVTTFQRRLPRPMVLVAAGVSLFGVAILTGLLQFDNWRLKAAPDGFGSWKTGDSLTLLAVLFFSGQIVVVDWFGKRLDSLAFTPSMFATTTILSAAFFWFTQITMPESGDAGTDATWVGLSIQPRFLGLIGLLAIFHSLMAFSLMNRFQPSVSATQASVIYTLEPLLASMWAMFVPGILCVLCTVQYANETLTRELAIGGLILIFSNVLAMWPSEGPKGASNPKST